MQKWTIQQMLLKFELQFNILFANMKEIQGTVIGQMFVQMLGDEENIQQAIAYLEQHGVRVLQTGVQQ